MMNAIDKLLDEAKTKKNLRSDNALAIEMELNRASICDYRKNRKTPDIFAMSRLADLTGRPLPEVLALIEIEKEQSEERKRYWQNFYRTIEGIAAVFSIVALQAPIIAAFERYQCILCSIGIRKTEPQIL